MHVTRNTPRMICSSILHSSAALALCASALLGCGAAVSSPDLGAKGGRSIADTTPGTTATCGAVCDANTYGPCQAPDGTGGTYCYQSSTDSNGDVFCGDNAVDDSGPAFLCAGALEACGTACINSSSGPCQDTLGNCSPDTNGDNCATQTVYTVYCPNATSGTSGTTGASGGSGSTGSAGSDCNTFQTCTGESAGPCQNLADGTCFDYGTDGTCASVPGTVDCSTTSQPTYQGPDGVSKFSELDRETIGYTAGPECAWLLGQLATLNLTASNLTFNELDGQAAAYTDATSLSGFQAAGPGNCIASVSADFTTIGLVQEYLPGACIDNEVGTATCGLYAVDGTHLAPTFYCPINGSTTAAAYTGSTPWTADLGQSASYTGCGANSGSNTSAGCVCQ